MHIPGIMINISKHWIALIAQNLIALKEQGALMGHIWPISRDKQMLALILSRTWAFCLL